MSYIVHSEEHNGYTYSVYDNGTTVATGEIQNETASRNTYVQQTAGGDSRLPSDHGGHLVPASQNGTSNAINISAQDAKVNTRDVRGLEREESRAVRNGVTIETERIAFHSNDINRPDAYMFNDHLKMPDGTTSDIHRSYTNVDMSKYNDDIGLENAPNSYDAAKNSGYSKGEYESILEEADNMAISDFEQGWTSSSLPGNGDVDGVDLSSGNNLDDCYSINDEVSDGNADTNTLTDSDNDMNTI